jgi:DNA topoisomerase-1
MLGKEKNKFVPTPVGIRVSEYLLSNFDNIMDYQFTADMEEKLDNIVNGEAKWYKVLKEFYEPFAAKLDCCAKLTPEQGKLLGKYPGTEDDIYVGTFTYGDAVKLGKKFVSIEEPETVDTMTLEKAIELLKYPMTLGEHDGHPVEINKGRYGFYIHHHLTNISITKEECDINLDAAIEKLAAKSSDNINSFTHNKKVYNVREGKYGPYISYINGTKNKKPVYEYVKIPKKLEAKDLTMEDVLNLVNNSSKPVEKKTKEAPKEKPVKEVKERKPRAKKAAAKK